MCGLFYGVEFELITQVNYMCPRNISPIGIFYWNSLANKYADKIVI